MRAAIGVTRPPSRRRLAPARRGATRMASPFLLAAVTAFALPAPGELLAQEPPQLEDVISTRTLVISDVAFLGTARPALLVGGLHQRSFRPIRTEPDEEGFPERVPPSWYAHLAITAGWSLEKDPGGGAVARLGAGAVRRVDPTIVSALGPVVSVTVGERTFGAAARVELLDNVGLQMGWVHRERESADRLLVSVDALHCILADLGIWEGACGGGG